MIEPEIAIPQDWVNVAESAEITGYSREYISKLAMKIWKKPENDRQIRLRKRSNRFELWLPDLVAYTKDAGHGPQRKRK